MGIKKVSHSPYSQDVAPCDFWLFPKLRGCRYETIEEIKEAVTKVIDTLTQEDFHGAFQKLLEWYNSQRRRLLWRGLEFHVCTINKSASMKKSLETYLMIIVSSFCTKLILLCVNVALNVIDGYGVSKYLQMLSVQWAEYF